ncbi:TPA: hypothetical protein KEU07_003080 [Serratia marcescens]|nr:hypothetical protein [Serratia marcescens]
MRLKITKWQQNGSAMAARWQRDGSADFFYAKATPAIAGVFLVAIQKPAKLDRRFVGEVEPG